MTTTRTPTSGAAIKRYKIGYREDEWGQRSSTPSGIPDASGSWVRYADHVTALAAGQAPKAAPGDVLDEALRERDDAEDFIDALLDEVLGHERPEWSSSYGHADALNDVQERMTALHKPAVDKAWGRFQSAMAAPQQEAQEPVAWQGVHDQTDLYYTKPTQADVRPLYAAPQPAPAPLSDDTKRLAWVADGWTPGHEKLYTQHVLETGGVGDVDDLCTFIDKQIAAQGGKA